MKFTKLAVIGNPPYQMSDGTGGKGSSAKPIYHLFIDSVINNLTPDYLSFIVPSRWMAGGRGLDNFREKMIKDKRFSKIVHFPGSFSVFPTVEIGGGVNYFLWDKSHTGKCNFESNGNSVDRFLDTYDIIIQDNNVLPILEKVLSVSNKYISEFVLPQNAFQIRSNFSEWVDVGVNCYCEGKEIKKVPKEVLTDKHKIIGKYKVVIGKANNSANPRVIAHPFIIPPNEICSESYLVINTFNTKKESDNFCSYVCSRVFRFMLLIRKITQNISNDVFMWVPDMEDYSSPWTDEELYKKFNLTRQQINYIESKIKEFK